MCSVGSGLLYGGIGVLWLVVLGRTWLHRRTLARAERSAPASSRQRILELRSDRRSRSRTVLPGSSEPAGAAPVAPVRSRAVRRRRRILLALVILAAGLVTLFVLGRAPWWAPVAGAVLALGWFASGASAARAARRARRGHRRRVRSRELARGVGIPSRAVPVAVREPDEPWATRERSWDSVPQVEVVARWGREQSDTDGIDRRQLVGIARGPIAGVSGAGAAGVRAAGDEGVPLVSPGPFPPSRYLADRWPLPGPLIAGTGDGARGGSWAPAPVPLPSYLTAPRVPRTVARIDLTCPGSWTSAGAPVPADGVPTPAARHATSRPRPRPLVDVEIDGEDEATDEVPYALPRAVGD